MTTHKDDEEHGEVMRKADEAHVADLENREEALDDLRFCAGGRHQWDITVLQEREADGRPIITVNRMGQFVHQISGEARTNRPSIKVRPVDDESDPDTADIIEGIVRHIEDQSEAVSASYIPAIEYAARCGISAWRVNTEWADDDTFGQDIFIRPIHNPLAVLWDPYAKAADRSDANYCFVIEDIPEEEYEDKYPDHPIADFTSGLTAIFWRDVATKTVRIAEYWYKEPYKKHLGQTKDGKTIDLTKIPKQLWELMGIVKDREVDSFKVCSRMVSGIGFLTEPQPWAGKYIPIVACIGEEIHVGEHRARSGIVRHAKDPQRLYNLWRSLQAETIAMQPKTPYVGTAKQFEKYKSVWLLANKRNFPYLPYDPDDKAPPPMRQTPPQASQAMMEEAMLSVDEMKATTGVYDASLGNKSNETSGVAIENRDKQAATSNAHFADNLALSIRHTGRILVDLIPEIYDTEKVVRLLNEDGSEKWEHINKLIQTPQGPQFFHDLSLGKYDVAIKTGPSYATRRQESADFLLQFMQTMPDSAHFVADLLAKNLDAPGAEELAKRFRILLNKTNPELFPEGTGEPPSPPTQADQNNALMAHAQLTKLVAEAQLAEAQAEDAEMDTALKGAQVHALAVGDPLAQMVEQTILSVLQRKFGGAQQPQQAQQAPTAPQPAVAPHLAPFVPPPAQPQGQPAPSVAQ